MANRGIQRKLLLQTPRPIGTTDSKLTSMESSVGKRRGLTPTLSFQLWVLCGSSQGCMGLPTDLCPFLGRVGVMESCEGGFPLIYIRNEQQVAGIRVWRGVRLLMKPIPHREQARTLGVAPGPRRIEVLAGEDWS